MLKAAALVVVLQVTQTTGPVQFGIAHLDPADVGDHEPTCVSESPEWEWHFEIEGGTRVFVDAFDVTVEGEAGHWLRPSTYEPEAVWVTSGNGALVDGYAMYQPPDEQVGTLDLIALCAPAEPTSTTTTVGAEVLSSAVEAPPAPVQATQPAFTG